MRFPRFLRRPVSLRPWRRHHEREAWRLAADWHVFGSSVHRVSTTADVSEGGIFLLSAAPLPVGSPLVISLALPRGQVEVHGRVVRIDARGMGVRFSWRVAVGIA
ncbi:MAG TPA: PilZ domain-containing protein [Polyangiaceae bacterium]|jgi:hypothetical protein